MELIVFRKGIAHKVYYDEKDHDKITCCKWYLQQAEHTLYAYTHIYKTNGKRSALSMHRLIINPCNPKHVVDHKDRNGLNNRSSNLRESTTSQNQMNRIGKVNSVSGLKGVNWDKHNKRWQAMITLNGQRHFLGYFSCKFTAAKVYDLKARELFGKFAKLNFPEDYLTKPS